MVQLSEALQADIRAHAERDYPHECCGALLGRLDGDARVVTALRSLPNVHDEGHERRYRIAPDAMFAIEREARAAALKVLGFYHSHPDHPARPSEYDREWAWPWYRYVIVAVEGGSSRQMTCWSLRDDRSAFDEESIGA